MLARTVNISTGETREPGAVSRTFGEQVESNPQAELKSPAEYVRMAMKAHKEDRQLTSEEFMQATDSFTDSLWTALYERPDLYVYVTEDIINSEDLIKFDNFDFNLLLL